MDNSRLEEGFAFPHGGAANNRQPQHFRRSMHGRTQSIHHRQEQVAHRRLAPVKHPAAGLEVISAAPGDQRGQVMMNVIIAVRQSRPVDDHRMVQQGSITFFDSLDLRQPLSELPHMITVDAGNFFYQFGNVTMVGQGMMPSGIPISR